MGAAAGEAVVTLAAGPIRSKGETVPDDEALGALAADVAMLLTTVVSASASGLGVSEPYQRLACSGPKYAPKPCSALSLSLSLSQDLMTSFSSSARVEMTCSNSAGMEVNALHDGSMNAFHCLRPHVKPATTGPVEYRPLSHKARLQSASCAIHQSHVARTLPSAAAHRMLAWPNRTSDSGYWNCCQRSSS